MKSLRNKLLNPKNEVQHISFKEIDATPIIEQYLHMGFSARKTAEASMIYLKMLKDEGTTIILTLAGSAPSAGCLHVIHDLITENMVDVIVSTGAVVVDMDVYEALGGKHYKGTDKVDDAELGDNQIDRIYDTFIDEVKLKECDMFMYEMLEELVACPSSSQELISQIGKRLSLKAKDSKSFVKAAYENGVPIFVPAFSDCSFGFGISKHQFERQQSGKPYVSIDSGKDFLDLTKIVIKVNQDGGSTGLFMIGGGSPKNFAQDTVVNAEILGFETGMHKYAVQITVADPRDGACSSSTLEEARSWAKVELDDQVMVFAEATTVWPLIASHAYGHSDWQSVRSVKNYVKWLDSGAVLKKVVEGV